MITTVAGNGFGGGYSGDGGPPPPPSWITPGNVAVDGLGDLFVADFGENVIREVNIATGVITSVTGGEGNAGYTGNGGPATAATLSSPAGMTFDAEGNLYVADAGNNVVREIATSVPTFVLSAPSPARYNAGQNVTIQWNAAYVPSGNSNINLAYAPDATAWSPNAHWIYDAATATDGSGAYTWNTTGVAAGTYYLSGYLWDATTSQPVYASLANPIVITAIPTFTITGPAAGSYVPGQSVTIQWTATNVNPRQHDQPGLRRRGRSGLQSRALDRDRRDHRGQRHGELHLEYRPAWRRQPTT